MCELIGSLEFHPWSAMFEQLRRVYGANGDSPALNANGGGIAKSRFLKSIFTN